MIGIQLRLPDALLHRARELIGKIGSQYEHLRARNQSDVLRVAIEIGLKILEKESDVKKDV